MSGLSKKLLPVAVLIGAGVVAAALIWTAPEAEVVERATPIRAVRVVEPTPQALPLVVRSQGTVVPRTESELIPEVSGRVVWMSPALVSGGFFDQGDPLLRVERNDYEAARARAAASLARAEGESEHAQATLQRREDLSRQGVASPSQLDDARRQARVAEAGLAEARVGLEQAERDLARTTIAAPYAGRVREEKVDLGQFLTRGQPIASLYATDYVEVRLPIPDDELAYLDLPLFGGADADGPAVTLRARFAGRPQQWQGQIVRTEGEIDTQSRMVHAVARIERPYEAAEGGAPLAVGLFVEAEIEGPIAEGVIRVPRGALRNQDELLVVDAENRLQLAPVELLRLEREDALVRASLPEGTRVCISQVGTFSPGMEVRAVAATETAAPTIAAGSEAEAEKERTDAAATSSEASGS